MSLLEIPLKNNEFSTEIILISPEEVVSFQMMESYIYNLPSEPVSYSKIKAVIDTGATHTFIPEKIALDLNLQKTGKQTSSKLADGVKKDCNDYLCMICFPLKHIILMTVSALIVQDNNEVLIGMDLLQNKNFSYLANFSENKVATLYGGKLKIELGRGQACILVEKILDSWAGVRKRGTEVQRHKGENEGVRLAYL